VTFVLEPPAPLEWPADRRAIFLAGSIEMGGAPAWQDGAARALAADGFVALNPRRADWDASWRQSIDEPRFREQVEWELAAQERADAIAMYFVAETRSPITLLELGLFARSGKMVVCCPAGFWRRGNVDVVCARYGVPRADSLEELLVRARAIASAHRHAEPR
jgi:hypothetical protein